MKNRFIRTAAPISVLVIAVFDLAALVLLIFSIINISKRTDFISICFLIIELIVCVVAALTTKEQLKNGVLFKEKELIFTALDENNVYCYSEIEKAEVFKDTKASFKKTFVQRYSSVIIYLKDGSVATVELGITTKRALKRIEKELNERIKTVE